MIDDLFAPVPIANKITQQAIDDAISSNNSFHRIYVCLAINKDWRAQVNARWQEIKHLCERNFVTEFMEKDKFYSKLWELNLRYLFKDSIVRAPSSREPDLIGTNYAIEAVVPKPVDVPRTVYDGQLRDYPTDEISLRVTAAIKKKLDQFDERAAAPNTRIDYQTTPYVIAVGLPSDDFRDAKAMAGVSIVEAMLMGIGPMQMTLHSDGRTTIGNSTQFKMVTAKGVEFDVAYFLRPENAKISAVLWSAELIPQLSDIHLLQNPLTSKTLLPQEIGAISNIYTYSQTATGWQRDQKLQN